ncbi:putative Prefoldin subunit [Monocercomonoides exilis]|uniref:putative Prefoldin subunit n=1 Tax=Monocercomonoides exilis TaxID=2049356 RepID=UPI00355A857D|nr:putative Prefoldin subunit [Monocercomonoides exilis]|eukprot:MONOS_9519.1-p1 / transcript=MONOS_9519.1 / gene=MONOS_9519 / organism=Monocercomonoides_exilis_PA203 / gene_product=unspecified product / transcript_product=unspecified product / location=Mono_scaffold00396:10986-11525(-) / protein_length=121 / sequence_SO=supercontig / SO=protein_coding / is_pseudo=false
MSAQLAPEVQEKLDKLLAEIRSSQKELTDLASSRQKLLAQQTEHEMTRKELELAKDTDEIYKQVGTVMFPQSKEETIHILAQHEHHLKEELERVEKLHEAAEKKADELQKQLVELRQQTSS